MKNILSLLMVAAILAFPQKAYCENISYSYVTFDEEGVNSWKCQTLPSSSQKTIEADAKAALKALFGHTYEADSYGYPKGTEVLFVYFENGNLTVNISEEFCDFGGGSYKEKILSAQIIKTLLDMEGVETVTLLIESKLGNSPEGIIIKEVSTWQELTEEIIPD